MGTRRQPKNGPSANCRGFHLRIGQRHPISGYGVVSLPQYEVLDSTRAEQNPSCDAQDYRTGRRRAGHFNEQGFVHRDVKPDNFLVGDDGEVKLIDLALAVKARRGLARLFASRSKVQGTRSYMSPEQIRGAALDQRADVYSFACTVHELVSGRPPFTGTSSNELLNKHLKSPPPSLENFDRNVTPEFAKLVLRGLAKEPGKRPASVGEFLTEFRQCRVFKVIPRPPAKTPE